LYNWDVYAVGLCSRPQASFCINDIAGPLWSSTIELLINVVLGVQFEGITSKEFLYSVIDYNGILLLSQILCSFLYCYCRFET
jgi:hypothetical protein